MDFFFPSPNELLKQGKITTLVSDILSTWERKQTPLERTQLLRSHSRSNLPWCQSDIGTHLISVGWQGWKENNNIIEHGCGLLTCWIDVMSDLLLLCFMLFYELLSHCKSQWWKEFVSCHSPIRVKAGLPPEYLRAFAAVSVLTMSTTLMEVCCKSVTPMTMTIAIPGKGIREWHFQNPSECQWPFPASNCGGEGPIEMSCVFVIPKHHFPNLWYDKRPRSERGVSGDPLRFSSLLSS